MLVLSQTTDKIQVVLAAAVATNQAQCVASWRDITATPSYVAGRSVANTNGTTEVDLIAAPAASTQRVIDYVNVYNHDTANIVVTVKFDANGTDFILVNALIEPGQSLTYQDGHGWSVSGTLYMPIKGFTLHGDAGANFAMTNATQAERFAGNSSRHIFSVDLEGYKQVRCRGNLQVGSASVNDPRFRVRYFTTYSTVHGNYLQLGLADHIDFSVASVGYKDTGWLDMAPGARVQGVFIAMCELGGDGVADPAFGALDILFR